ncbi:MAG: dihydroorotase [Planctomycetota bacterium]
MNGVIWLRDPERVLDPAGGRDGRGDVWIRDGLIGGVGEAPPETLRPGARVVEADGCLVTPMFTDLHVHFREPGGERAETIATGVRAALAGGYASVWVMPNTQPTCDTPEGVRLVLERARAVGDCDVVPVAALSKGLQGRELVAFDALLDAGAGAFSDDGRWLEDRDLAEQAFRWAAGRGALVMQHCEDFGVTGDGVLHDAPSVRAAGLPGIPRRSEDVAVERDIELAARCGTRLHVCHVSTRGAVERIREARHRGLPVTGEATPHHLVLTCDDALSGGADFKMKPPLRERDDVEAVLEGLVDGTLQAIATDHAPHADDTKACGWAGAPFGAIGLETAFPVLFTRLVERGRLSLPRLVEALTTGPAAVTGRAPLGLAPGAPARVNVIDLHAVRRVDREELVSRSHNTPFHGMALRGWARAVVLGDRVVTPSGPTLDRP